MRPTWIPVFAACVFLAVSAIARADDLPYEGNWKITVLDPRFEATLWLIEVEKQGKEIKVLWGLAQYAKARPGNVKADAKAMTFNLALDRGQFHFSIQPPGKIKDKMLGSVRLGSNTLPVWLEKTDETELVDKTAVRPLSGAADLVAAGKQVDPKERIKGLQQVLKKHAGKPITHLVSQALLGQLVNAKADTKALRSAIDAYMDVVTPHGRLLVINGRLNVAQILVTRRETVELALESARAAARLIRADDNPQLQMSVQLALAATLHHAGKKDEVKTVAAALDRLALGVIKAAKGADAEFVVTGEMGRLLLSSQAPEVAEVGLEYARKVVKLLKKDSPVSRQLAAYKLLAQGLEVRGKKDEAAPLLEQIEKMETVLDEEYLKKSIPFEVEKFAGRKGKSERVVLVELFTGVQNRLCQASDVAFDAARKMYPAKDVVFVQYHVHVPGADALSNADSEARQKFYGSDLEDIPGVLVDGKLTVALGGERKRARVSFENLREDIDKALETEQEAKIALDVRRKGDTIEVKATVSDVKMPQAAMKLYLGLVEEMVRYPGPNGQRLHFHVLRAMMGGANGFKLDNKTSTHSATISLPALRKELEAYLTAYGRKHNVRWVERPMELKKLKVIAWVQDDDSKQVYQSAQANVPGEK